MKSSTRDEAEGKLHQVKGKIKEVVGRIFNKPDLETEGKVEGTSGKIQEKTNDVEKAVGK